MRNFICGLIGLIIANTSLSQSDSLSGKKQRSFEWGTNVYSSIVKGGDFYTAYKPLLNQYVLGGLYLKVYNKKNVFRYSAGYYQQITNDSYFLRKTPGSFVSSKTLQLSYGYQRLLGIRKFAPYVFADISGEHSVETIRDNYYNYPYWYKIDYYAGNSVRRVGYTAGISPGLGLRMKLRKHIVINIESAAQFFYSYFYGGTPDSYRMIGINAKPFTLQFGILF